ncbi:MAG: bifunctional methylenetetrahydrofolate dehydrogenase/methenyltetrahydrofolate cyclohydrolase FolD [Clostridiales bacterium]|nr:bifunctional methylenetetrahydrofolate dehydrogenase/methenyltetrahydrofolate cyclohydrolase FolD [Clostridiales bacterium]
MDFLIDGKKVAQEIKDELKEKVANLKSQGREITLVVVLVGSDPASQVYVRNKQKACEYVGINSKTYRLADTTTQDELLKLIDELNNDNKVNGILVQLPLPKHIDEDLIIKTISPLKDVDGFHPENVGKLSIGQSGFVSCTPAGVIELLKRYKIEIEGKHCVVIGRSNIVGKPMSMLLLRENATVTICHSRTKDLKSITKQADILVASIGKPRFVNKDFIKENAVVIDVGINRDENNKLCGDVDFEDVKDHVKAITPVPGGVGPMTIAMLLRNCLDSIDFQ